MVDATIGTATDWIVSLISLFVDDSLLEQKLVVKEQVDALFGFEVPDAFTEPLFEDGICTMNLDNTSYQVSQVVAHMFVLLS